MVKCPELNSEIEKRTRGIIHNAISTRRNEDRA